MFRKVAEMRLKAYRHNHNKSMSTPAIAQMTSTMLYHKRFFPYYISNILAGLDEEGDNYNLHLIYLIYLTIFCYL